MRYRPWIGLTLLFVVMPPVVIWLMQIDRELAASAWALAFTAVMCWAIYGPLE